MSARRPRPHRAQHGYTVTELVASVVVLGLVIGPLVIALNQAITLVPRSAEQTETATDHQRLLTQFSKDVAQADAFGTLQGIYESRQFTPVASTRDCPAVMPGPMPVNQAQFFTWYAGNPATEMGMWRLRFTNAGIPTLVRVEVQRAEEKIANVWVNWETYTSGYCTLGDTNVVTTATVAPLKHSGPTPADGVYDGGIGFTLHFKDREGQPLPPTTFEAKMRVTNWE